MTDLHTFEINGYRFYFKSNDRKTNYWLKRRFRKESIHEKNVVKILLERLKPDMCFVDVGAYLGFYSILASKHLSQGQVFSFEMDRNSYSALMQNLELNNCNNVQVYNKAITNFVGTAQYVTQGVLTSSKNRLDNQIDFNQNKKKKIIDTITLDVFFKNKNQKPDIIKIDVEGAEMKVLDGMEEILNESKSMTLFIEIHPNHLKSIFNSSEKEIFSKLIEKGFDIFQIKNFRKLTGELKIKRLNVKSRLRNNTMIFAQK
jgi:FkbM family methyltransferase